MAKVTSAAVPPSAAIASVTAEILTDAANPQLLVHARAEDGTVGVGETWWGTYRPEAVPGSAVRPIASMIDDVLAPMCVGRPSEDIAGLWHELVRSTYQYGHEGVVSSAISGIDIALWDLLGRRRGVPVTDLLGPIERARVPVYASLHWLGSGELILADARRALEAGITRIKLHEADADLARELRHELGPGVELMVDASARLDEVGAVAASRTLHAADISWLEEPVFPQDDFEVLARIRAASSVPIAAGENVFSVAGFERLLEAGAVDVLQPELAKCGGLTPAPSIAALAERHGIAVCPHNYSLGPSFLANVHWAFSTPVVRWIELPWLPAGQEFPSGMVPPALVDGGISRPRGAGLGFGMQDG